MTFQLVPSADYRYTLRKGNKGTDIAALQLNLEGLVIDGDFGVLTEGAVRAFQKHAEINVDGIAGPATQRNVVIKGSQGAATAHRLPPGLLLSIAYSESGCILAAYSEHPSDSGFDLGAYQDSIGPGQGSQTRYRNAFSVTYMAENTGLKVRRAHDRYAMAPAVKSDRRAWELAVLLHNWPAAADNLAFLGRIYKSKPDNVPETWIEQASGGRLHTAREWVAHYIENATQYVSWS